MSQKSRVGTFVAFAAGTVVVTLGVAMLAQILSEKSLEHLARLAGGESDFERHHPSKK